MKKLVTLMVIMVTVVCLSSLDAWAQRGVRWKGAGGWGPGTPYNKLYNPQAVETISGEVVSVGKIAPMRGMQYGVYVVVKTEKETISVHLGPDWYIENQDVKIMPKDKIAVKGSRITFEGKPAILAAEVKKGEEVLILRDASGIPVWSGWRRR
ncbi:MAG TPA: DNA-binding protein [Syntrophales bacterium]|nr:DNA-binding protein [Syntrophales bacterium]HOL59640.1 DNA-binding protein [Syntrophales bacterium]HPO35786.1 DNA-binding protein [Syntrophales bacterium]